MNKTGKNIIAIDLGGTKLLIARLGLNGEVQAEHKIPTHAKKGAKHVFADLTQMVNELKNKNTLAVGLGVPGFVRQADGAILKLPNIPHEGEIHLAAHVEEETGLPLFIDNDANCFALGVYKKMKNKPKVLLGLTLGTGFGAGIIINEELFRGTRGYAAEFGHVAFNEEMVWEQLVASKSPTKSRGHYLGMILASLINIFDPDAIALGGSISKKEFPNMESDMRAELEKRIDPGILQTTNIFVAQDKNTALLGAASLTNELKI